MNQGWIKLHRQILDNPLTSKPDWAWLWIVILLLANHEAKEIIWNGEKRIIQRGEFITSREKLSLYSHLHSSSVERALKYFKSEQQIEQQANKKFRLIKVLKYDQYQSTEQVIEHQVNNKRTSNEQQLNTNKNDNNYKNEKNDKKLGEINSPTPSDKMRNFINSHKAKDESYGMVVAYLIQNSNLTDEIVRRELDKFVNYWTELTKSGSKQRWEMEKTFEVQKRIATWFSNAGKFNKDKVLTTKIIKI